MRLYDSLMALSYADAATLASSANFKLKVRSAIADVSMSSIRTLAPTTTNYVQLINLSVRLLTDTGLLDSVCYLVAANAPGGVTVLATPVENTLPDMGAGSIKVLTTNAMNALVTI